MLFFNIFNVLPREWSRTSAIVTVPNKKSIFSWSGRYRNVMLNIVRNLKIYHKENTLFTFFYRNDLAIPKDDYKNFAQPKSWRDDKIASWQISVLFLFLNFHRHLICTFYNKKKNWILCFYGICNNCTIGKIIIVLLLAFYCHYSAISHREKRHVLILTESPCRTTRVLRPIASCN